VFDEKKLNGLKELYVVSKKAPSQGKKEVKIEKPKNTTSKTTATSVDLTNDG
jgi:hypothetical protein